MYLLENISVRKQKLILIIVISFLFSSVLTVLLTSPLIIDAIKLSRDGDSLLMSKPTQALEKYYEAQRKWPLLRFDKELQSQIEIAKQGKEKTKEKVAVTLFLKDGVTESNTQSLIKEIREIAGVRKVNLISKEDAFDRYKEKNKDEPLLLEFVTPDILPTSIEVFLDDLSVKSTVTQIANSKTFVEDIIETPD